MSNLYQRFGSETFWILTEDFLGMTSGYSFYKRFWWYARILLIHEIDFLSITFRPLLVFFLKTYREKLLLFSWDGLSVSMSLSQRIRSTFLWWNFLETCAYFFHKKWTCLFVIFSQMVSSKYVIDFATLWWHFLHVFSPTFFQAFDSRWNDVECRSFLLSFTNVNSMSYHIHFYSHLCMAKTTLFLHHFSAFANIFSFLFSRLGALNKPWGRLWGMTCHRRAVKPAQLK